MNQISAIMFAVRNMVGVVKRIHRNEVIAEQSLSTNLNDNMMWLVLLCSTVSE